jgi:hypothetical protein
LNKEKSKHADLSQQICVLALQFCTRCSESWLNSLQSLTPAVDWLDRLIGRGGLILVVSHLFALAILVLLMGLAKSKFN